MTRRNDLYKYWDDITRRIVPTSGPVVPYEIPNAPNATKFKNGSYPTETAMTCLSAYLEARDDPQTTDTTRDQYFGAFQAQIKYAHHTTQDGLACDVRRQFFRDEQARQILNFAFAHRLLADDPRMTQWMRRDSFSLLEWADTAAHSMTLHFDRYLYPYDGNPASYSLLFAATIERMAGKCH
jgi:hypothetical protein